MTNIPAAIESPAPLLVKFTREQIVDGLWQRPGLAPRDRSIVTLCTLISRNAVGALPHYFAKALDSGLEPAEVSELVTHVAFYGSWPNALAANGVLKDIFAQRGIGPNELPEEKPKLLSIEEALPDESARVAYIQENVAPISSALHYFTDELLYHEVWLRPGLSPRDRGLATISALCALGQFTFLPIYMNRAVIKGVTKEEIGELLGHIAFYAGWGLAIEAAAVANEFFAKRGER